MFGLLRHAPPFSPLPFGPEYEMDSASSVRPAAGPVRRPVRLKTGPLSGTTLMFEQLILPHKADYAFYHGAMLVGHCHFDREPETGLETLWEIIFRPEYQRKGLAALIVRLALRELLLTGKRHWVAIRKLMQVDSAPSSRGPLPNIGIGIIAVKLGFVPKPEFAHLLATANIKSVQLIEPTDSSPPGYLIHLNCLPGSAVVTYINPDSGRPLADSEAYRRFLNPAEIYRKALIGEAVIGNIDYTLAQENISRFGRYLADTPQEFRTIVTVLQKGARD